VGIVGAYVRVSTQDQEARGTYENQLDQINSFCARSGLSVQRWYREQESTLNLDRPEFVRLLNDLRAGNIDTIIVAALDRFSRNQIETLQVCQLVKDRGATFHAVRDNIHIRDGKADMGTDMVISVLSTFAHHERETIKDRTMRGKKRKQTKGLWVGGQAPAGYELDRETKILQINEDEAAVVRRIWDEKLCGKGVNAIVKSLTADAVPPFEQQVAFQGVRYCGIIRSERNSDYCRIRPAHSPYKQCAACIKEYGGVPERGRHLWAKTTITRILKNKTYIGLVPLQKEQWIPGEHKPIVTQDEWDKVQRLFAERAARKNRIYPTNPIAGLVRCVRCGRKMFVTSGTRRGSDGESRLSWRGFRCPGKKGGVCSQPSQTLRNVEEAVYLQVYDILASDQTAKLVHAAFRKIGDNWGGESLNIEELAAEFSQLDGEIKLIAPRMADAASEGLTEVWDALKVRSKALDLRRKSVRSQIDLLRLRQESQLQDIMGFTDREALGSVVTAYLAHLELMNSEFEQAQDRAGEVLAEIIRSFVKEIQIDGSKVTLVPIFQEDRFEAVMSTLVEAILKVRELSKKLDGNADTSKDITRS
jgi:site-specific DNA recombinase